MDARGEDMVARAGTKERSGTRRRLGRPERERHIIEYHQPIPDDLDTALDQGIEMFLLGAPAQVRALIAGAPAARRAARVHAAEE